MLPKQECNIGRLYGFSKYKPLVKILQSGYWQNDSTFYMGEQRKNKTNRNSQVNVEGKQNWRMDTCDFKTCLRATVVRVCDVDGKTDKWSMVRIKSPEMDPDKYSQLIFGKKNNKGNIMMQGSLFKRVLKANWIATCKNINLGIGFSPSIKINSEWIIDLHVQCKTIEVPEVTVGENWMTLGMAMSL